MQLCSIVRENARKSALPARRPINRDCNSASPCGVLWRSCDAGWRIAVQAMLHSRDMFWDPSFPLENTKSSHPKNPGKLLKNYNLAHPRTVLKVAEKLLPKITPLVNFQYFISASAFLHHFRTGPGGTFE